MKLIVGLGNPGKKYQNTRHNLGQKIIEEFVKNYYKVSLQEKKTLSSQLYETKQGNDKIIFAIPTEYMNNSGLAVQKITQFYKISPSDIYVVHDDLDLSVGEYRFQFDRGSAGHNGIKSIIENINTQQFYRFRIGISKPQNNTPVEDYVLQPFSSEEKVIINNLLPKVFNEIKNIL